MASERQLNAAPGSPVDIDAQSVRHPGKIQVIEPTSGWNLINLGELWQYRDLFYFLVWRDIKVRYAQSALGISWALIQPFFFMIAFTIVFGNFVKVKSDDVPYPVFSYIALVPWTYFSASLVASTSSLIQNTNMLSKVYFPRLALPMSAVAGNLLDFFIAFSIVGGLMAWYGIAPTIWALFAPVLLLIMVLSAAGLGMWLTALAIQYRDVKHALTFMVQLLMFAGPVVYPASTIPDEWRLLYGINPMAGVIEGFRSSMLDSNPMPWDLIWVGSVVAVGLFATGMFYFRRMERIFADVA